MAADVRPGRQRPAADGIITALNTQRKADVVLAPRDRLESWKEIAVFLNRSERTVRRWEEREGLPVHRLQHDKRGSVYAYTWELDAWRDSRRQLIEIEPPETVEAAAPSPSARRPARWWMPAAAALVLAASGGGYWIVTRRAAARSGPPTRVQHTPNPEALRAFQKAQFGANSGRVQIQTGIRYFQEAIRLDPAFARAWAGLATGHIALTWFGEVPAAETMADAKREARQALQLNPSLGEGWRVLAFASHYLDWDHATAEKQYRKAIELNPRDAVALTWFGDFFSDLRRFEEARVFHKRAQDANPRWLSPITFAGNVHYFTGNVDLAIAEYQQALEIEPNYGLANHFLGRAYLAGGQRQKAIGQLRKSNELVGHVPFSISDLGYALAMTGQQAEAERMLAGLMQKREHGYYPAFSIGVIHLGLGHTDIALDWLERAADERHMGFYLPSVDPIYDPLRSHPRFRKLMERMNLGDISR